MPVTGEIEARLTDIKLMGQLVESGDELVRVLRLFLTDPSDHQNDAQRVIRRWQSPKVVAVTRMSDPPSLDRASGDGVRALTDAEMQDIFEREYSRHNGRNGKDHARAAAFGSMRAALSAVSIPRGEVALTSALLKAARHYVASYKENGRHHPQAQAIAADLIAQIDAALAVPLPPAGGWRLVPVEPTASMLRAAYYIRNMYDSFHTLKPLPGLWTDMLAAAPAPPASGKETT